MGPSNLSFKYFDLDLTFSNYGFNDLKKAVNGTHNIGELRFETLDGRIHTINSHNIRTSKNNVISVESDNVVTRNAVLRLLEEQFGDNAKLGVALNEIRERLVGGSNGTKPISRDEVRFMISLLESEAKDSTATVLTANQVRAKLDLSERLKTCSSSVRKAWAKCHGDEIKTYIKGWGKSTVLEELSVNVKSSQKNQKPAFDPAAVPSAQAKGKTDLFAAETKKLDALLDSDLKALRGAGADNRVLVNEKIATVKNNLTESLSGEMTSLKTFLDDARVNSPALCNLAKGIAELRVKLDEVKRKLTAAKRSPEKAAQVPDLLAQQVTLSNDLVAKQKEFTEKSMSHQEKAIAELSGNLDKAKAADPNSATTKTLSEALAALEKELQKELPKVDLSRKFMLAEGEALQAAKARLAAVKAKIPQGELEKTDSPWTKTIEQLKALPFCTNNLEVDEGKFHDFLLNQLVELAGCKADQALDRLLTGCSTPKELAQAIEGNKDSLVHFVENGPARLMSSLLVGDSRNLNANLFGEMNFGKVVRVMLNAVESWTNVFADLTDKERADASGLHVMSPEEFMEVMAVRDGDPALGKTKAIGRMDEANIRSKALTDSIFSKKSEFISDVSLHLDRVPIGQKMEAFMKGPAVDIAILFGRDRAIQAIVDKLKQEKPETAALLLGALIDALHAVRPLKKVSDIEHPHVVKYDYCLRPANFDPEAAMRKAQDILENPEVQYEEVFATEMPREAELRYENLSEQNENPVANEGGGSKVANWFNNLAPVKWIRSKVQKQQLRTRNEEITDIVQSYVREQRTFDLSNVNNADANRKVRMGNEILRMIALFTNDDKILFMSKNDVGKELEDLKAGWGSYNAPILEGIE